MCILIDVFLLAFSFFDLDFRCSVVLLKAPFVRPVSVLFSVDVIVPSPLVAIFGRLRDLDDDKLPCNLKSY